MIPLRPKDIIAKGLIVRIPAVITKNGRQTHIELFRKWNTDKTLRQLILMWVGDELGLGGNVDDSILRMFTKNNNMESPVVIFDKWAIRNKYYTVAKNVESPEVNVDDYF